MTRRRTWLVPLLLLAAFAVVHGQLFVLNLSRRHWEDGRHFRHNRDAVHSLADCFTTGSAWPGGAEATYRPLSGNLYYLAGRTLFDNRIEVYHLVNALVFLVNGLLLFALGRQLLPEGYALLAAALFVSRVAHLQVVAYTSEFMALSYVGFCLAGAWLFVRGRQQERGNLEGLALLAFALALLCKEAAVVWPALLVCYGWIFDRASAWRRYLGAWLLAGAWGGCYPLVLQALYPATTPGFALDLTVTGVLSRYAAYLLAFFNSFVDAIDPEVAGFAMAPRVSALSQTTPAIAAMGALVLAATLALVRLRLRPAGSGDGARSVVFGFAWFLVAMAPFVVFSDRLYMRYSYFGHAGLALVWGGVARVVVGHLTAWRRRRAARLVDAELVNNTPA